MLKALLKSTRPVIVAGLRTNLKIVAQPILSTSIAKFNFSTNDPKKDPKTTENWSKQDENKSEKKHESENDKKEGSKTADSKKTKEEKERETKKKEEKIAEEEISNEEPPKKKKQGSIFEGLDADYFRNLDLKEFFDPNKNPNFNWRYVGAGLVLGGFALYQLIGTDETISYNEFRTLLDSNSVSKIVIVRSNNKNQTYSVALVHAGHSEDAKPKRLILGNVDHFLETLEKHQLENGRAAEKLVPVEFSFKGDSSQRFDQFVNVMWILVSMGILFSLVRSTKGMMNQGGKGGGGGNDIFGMSKSGVQVFGLDQKIPIRFKDVAGQDEAKLEITEFVEFLKKPKKFRDIGAKIPRGALLAGPPGTGKTLLAKAAAGEAGVPFLYISGSDFVEMFVGVGASRVRDLFKKAKTHAPSIIFIDEIDAVGRKREGRLGGSDERDSTLNQLLVEMDGFGTDASVVIMAATNRKELLDPALTRPGRFDRSIDVTLPDIEGRAQIFMIHLKPIKLDPAQTMEEYAKRLATLTPGFSGAEIHNLCNEAAILAARKNKKFVSPEDFESAAERVMAGLEKKKIVSEEERRTVAVHESGHAVVSWFLEGGNPLLKLTIIPRSKGSLGYAQYLPNESSLETKEELLDRISCILGGRCSEELFNKKVTTGAYDDLKKAYEVAYAIVTKFGMSERIGFLGIPETEYVKKYSDETNKIIDEEIRKIIEECTEKTRKTVREHKVHIENLTKALLEKETLDLNQITAILGPRPFPPKSNFKAYLEVKKEMNNEADANSSEKPSAQTTTN